MDNNSEEEKYIGDLITGDGKNEKNILSRKSKGFGIAGDILAILEEVPFGTHKIEAGLVMRNSMLINGMLTNSETWYNLSENDISHFEEVDKYLLRRILNAHSKTPIEMLYLETGAIPIKYIIKQRRISYLHHLLTRDDKELIKKVYMAQKRKPVKGDWVLTVQQDLKDINFNIDESQIKGTKKLAFKKKLKQKIIEASYVYLEKMKSSHSKVKDIVHTNLKLQPYIASLNLNSEEKQTLFKLRTRMTNVRSNFKTMHIDVSCEYCDKGVMQTDAHLLDCLFFINNCPQLQDNNVIEYEDIFMDIKTQVPVTKIYKLIFEIKSEQEDLKKEEVINEE